MLELDHQLVEQMIAPAVIVRLAEYPQPPQPVEQEALLFKACPVAVIGKRARDAPAVIAVVVKLLRQECVDNNVTFVFCGTGRRFVKDGRLYKLEGNIQSQQARKSGMSFRGKPIHFDLYDSFGYPVRDEDKYKSVFRERCKTCGMQMCCNGCSNCGKCE